MKRNPQNIHHVHHRQNDILYNKQLPLMNEVIGTKRPRKYENISINLIIGKKFQPNLTSPTAINVVKPILHQLNKY